MPAHAPAIAAAQGKTDSGPHTMRCLEVWGGNRAVDSGVVMAGLDAWLFSRPFPGHAAGGDIHYVSSCAAGMLTRLLVADVSGHGEPVAGAADELRGLMRRFVNYVDQTHFVQELDRQFAAINGAGGFATAVVGTFDALAERFTLCNAGHPRPLWYRARTRQWALLDRAAAPEARARVPGAAANTPLGIGESASYDQSAVTLATGDLVVLYTDWLIEARGRDGRPLGEEGLVELARSLDVSDPGDFMHALLQAVAASGAATPVEDDLTILILRPNGLRPRVPPMLLFKYVGHMARAALGKLRPGSPPFPWPASGPMGALGVLVNKLNPRWGVPPVPRA